MQTPPIVSPQQWDAEREKLLAKEKAFTRARDALAAAGRRQLIVYRAFFAPDVTTYPASDGSYPARACVGCSFGADQVAHPAHLNARDTTLAWVSRAPQAAIRDLQRRMGWELIPWYSL